jgi:hypothetical protein
MSHKAKGQYFFVALIYYSLERDSDSTVCQWTRMIGLPSRGAPAKNIYTKSERLTVAEELGRVNKGLICAIGSDTTEKYKNMWDIFGAWTPFRAARPR